MKRLIIPALAACLISVTSNAQPYDADWESLDKRETPSWFEDAKFGIFVHWGVYSVPSWAPAGHDGESGGLCYSEHYWNQKDGNHIAVFAEHHDEIYGEDFRYEDFAGEFKAEMFSSSQWARIFKNSGARYVVLTSKHHEGFCLWPSKYSKNWNASEVGPHRDLLGELTSAVRDAGLKMGYYYSLLEWFNPLYKQNTIEEYVTSHMLPQMKELVQTYHPDIFWPDGEWDYDSVLLHSEEFLAWLFNESDVKDSVVVSDRWGRECRSRHGGFYTTEYGAVGFGRSEDGTRSHPWEECRGIGDSFGFNRNEDLSDYQTSEQLIHLLVKTVSRGGNLLLNVGPTADGRIPLLFQQRLFDIGRWLDVNGEAIYGTRKVEGANAGADIYLTQKGKYIYAIVTAWPDSKMVISGLRSRAVKVEMLGSKADVKFRNTSNGLIIEPVAISTPDDLPCQYAWTYRITLK